jgi:hypothetical protein
MTHLIVLTCGLATFCAATLVFAYPLCAWTEWVAPPQSGIHVMDDSYT